MQDPHIQSMTIGSFDRQGEHDSRAVRRYVAPLGSQALDWRTGLYVAGRRELLVRSSVAVVGSRAAPREGLLQAAAVARELVRLGQVVVSGLAAGVDAEAHRAVIACGGDTIAVIGTELGRAYPRENATLQERIYRQHLLASPFAPGTPTRPANFPIRNRVMARLTIATVLVAAGETSGTRHQVRECLAVGRPVLVSRGTTGVSWVRDLVEAGRVAVWDRPSDLRSLLALCWRVSPFGRSPTSRA